MSRSHKTTRLGLASENLATWPDVAEAGLTESSADAYRARKQAIDLYASNKTAIKEITQLTGIGKKQLLVLAKKCLRKHADGNIFGFRALVRHARTVDYGTATNQVLARREPTAGVFIALLKAHPEISKKLFSLAIFGTTEPGELREIDLPLSVIHRRFVELCLDADIKAPQYPFNDDSEGRPAVERWVKRVYAELQHREGSYGKGSGVLRFSHSL